MATQIKKIEKTQKQLNEMRGLQKIQNKTKKIILKTDI
jgi:hypothetical protein